MDDYFRALPDDVQQALGKAAFDSYIHAPPEFQFTGKWSDLAPNMQARWMTVAENVLNEADRLEENVIVKMQTFNETRNVLASAVERFEGIRAEDIGRNNYQLYETLRSALAEVDNARLLMLRADIAAGNVNEPGDGDTLRVSIPNRRMSE